jgi:hypothetical protein
VKITVGLTIVLGFIVTGMVIIAARTIAQHTEKASSPPEHARKFSKKGGRAPMKISHIRSKARLAPVNKPFVDGDDWLKDLVVELANSSEKTVTFVTVQILFPSPEEQLKKPGAAVFLQYGDNPFNYSTAEAMPPVRVNPVLPGDYLELALSNDQYDTIKSLLASAGIQDNNNVEIRVSAIGFSDGTAWSGRMAQRNSKGRWLPAEDESRVRAQVNYAHKTAPSPCRFGFPITTECTSDPEGCKRTDFVLFDDLPGDSLDDFAIVACSKSGQLCSQQLGVVQADCAISCTFYGDTCLANNECCSGECNEGTCGGCDPPCPANMVCFGGVCTEGSPILIDVSGNGFDLTDASGGVSFDVTGEGPTIRMAWTSANSDDAWLALDRNGNGAIDNGKELFGNVTPQALVQGVERNGFLALAAFDHVANGGDGDGFIGSSDAIFSRLLLWQDTNHNGISEPTELKSLPQFGVKALDLNYKTSQRTDDYGNRFKYRAKVISDRPGQNGRWAWDVFLVSTL